VVVPVEQAAHDRRVDRLMSGSQAALGEEPINGA